MKKKTLIIVIGSLAVILACFCIAISCIFVLKKYTSLDSLGYKQVFNSDKSNQEEKTNLDHDSFDEYDVYYPEGYGMEKYEIAVAFFNRFNDRNNNRSSIAVSTLTLEGDETDGFNYFYENTDEALENCRQQSLRKLDSREAKSGLTQTVESYGLIRNEKAFGCRYKVSDLNTVGEFLEVAVKGNANDKRIKFYYIRISYTAYEEYKEIQLLRDAFKKFTIKANKDKNLPEDIIVGNS